jgi:hypothetical protein
MWKIANVVTEPTFEHERKKVASLGIQMFYESNGLDDELKAWMGDVFSATTLL